MTNTSDFTFGRAELDAAVAKGVLDRNAADNLTEFLIQNRNSAASDPDEERLRLITGFNDIFVTIGIALFLGAMNYLLASYNDLVSGLGVAIASWGLAEVFTKRKRMALPSIVLLVIFVLSCAKVGYAISSPTTSHYDLTDFVDIVGLPYGLAFVGAAALHWFRFHVPMTVAAFVAGVAFLSVRMIASVTNGVALENPRFVFIPIGLAIFAIAMKFDMSDRSRLTQQTDIAFWLHLLAAPLIVHSVVQPLLAESVLSTGAAIAILTLFAILSFVALAIDRRALLVSSLLYLSYASSQILTWSGVASENAGLSILIVGGTVLVLSVAWQPLRRIVLQILPQAVRDLVPPAAP